MTNFETELADLIAKWLAKGETTEGILSAMELQTMAIEEESVHSDD